MSFVSEKIKQEELPSSVLDQVKYWCTPTAKDA
jgi:hypothetical protein